MPGILPYLPSENHTGNSIIPVLMLLSGVGLSAGTGSGFLFQCLKYPFGSDG